MSKVTFLADLYKKSVQEYTKNPAEWKGLLSCVARYYKRSFDNAVLIYAQRPDASQLATFDEWHDKRINRNINRGAKGIAVIDMVNPTASLKHLFDFMDTNGDEQSFKRVLGYLWELEDQYKPSLLVKFHEKYHIPTSSIERCLYKLVQQRVRQVLPQYMENFKVSDESSMLYGAPAQAVKAEFMELITDSVAYTVFQKCGLSTELFDENAFTNISHFNSLELFMAMGSCTVSLARPLLKEIHQEIQQIKIERSQIYENRTVNEPHLSAGRGRDVVPQPANLGERGNRPDAGGQIREPVERLHDGEPPAPPVGAGGTGQNQRNDSESGRGSREPQGTADTGASHCPADAGHRGYAGESQSHEYDNLHSGGNRDNRAGATSPITETAEPPIDGKQPSMGGFFAVPPKAEPVAPASIPPQTVQPLDEEEISDLIDVVLCADDLTPDTREWVSEIHKFFEGGHKQTTKSKILKAYYGKLDTEYLTKTGDYFLHILADSEGLTFETEGQQFAASYDELTNRIDNLILMGAYPYSSADSMTDDFSIPDEMEEMQGVSNEDEPEPEEPIASAALSKQDRQQIIDEYLQHGSGTQGGRQRIYQAMLSMPAKKDRVDLIRKEYNHYGYYRGLDNGGHWHLESTPKGLAIDYRSGNLELHEVLSWNQAESGISDLIQQDRYLTEEDKTELEAEGRTVYIPVPEPVKEAPERQLTLFDMAPVSQDSYEDSDDDNNDSVIDGNSDEPQPLPFAEGDRIYYHDRVFEIVKFLHDGRTVEIGDIAQLKNLNRLRITERVPLSEVADCKPLKDHHTDGELASMVVEAVQSGDSSEETKAAIQAAALINQSNEEYNDAIMDDFHARAWGEGINYFYSPDHHLYDGGPKTKCKNNIEAIRLLKELQAQGRMATAEEQITLARFVGWGGLANALTPEKSRWEKEYAEIKELLTDEEFQAAQKSTLTSYYTEQSVISHIYQGLENMGFRGGNILDPALGTGNFFSVLPDSMKSSKLYGCEIDPIPGHIAKHLYPDADIQVTGFEKTAFSDHFFDVMVGNVPFNSIKVDDPRYNKHNLPIHDYFIAKSLDKVRPGGVLALITSKFTLDKANSKMRRYIAGKAELIGAIRLPNNAFKQVAGTEATTDILFLKKREREIVPDEENSPWLSVEQNADGMPMNSYFIDHPEMVLGEMVFDESMFGNEKTTACHPIPGENLNERLERAISYLDGEYTEATSEYEDEKEMLPESIPADPKVRNFSYGLMDSELYYRENSRMYKQNITGRKAERIRGMLEITAAIRSLIDFQNSEYADLYELPTQEYEKQLQEHIAHLNHVYDAFIKKQGYLNSYANVMAFSRDANAPLLRSIEAEKKDQKDVWEKTAIFYKATIKPKVMPKTVHSAEEALMVSLNIKGKLDLAYMSWLYQRPNHRKASPDEIIEELGDRIYQDPEDYTGNPYTGWKTADEYLSGYVKDKLAAAILKAEEEPERFSRNVEALKLVQPVPLTPQDISFTLGSTWIPPEIYQQFMYDTFQTAPGNQEGRFGIFLEFSRYSGAYHITSKSAERTSVMVNQSYGTDRMNAYDILETTLNLRPVEVKDPVDYIDPDTGEEKTKYVLNKKETILAREKQAEIKLAFESWLFADPERGASLTKLYNDRFNNIRPREYNGDDLLLPDMAEGIKLRQHQRDVIAHGLYGDGNLLIAHEVGAGKTYAAIGLGYEMKRLGAIHKPLYAVPNHLVGEWATHYMKMYPNANILVAEKKDFEKKNRRRFVSRIATGEYDAVIMGHSSFELIGLSRERQLAAMEAELEAITNAISEQKARDGKDWTLKQMEIFKANLQFRYDRLFKAEKKDDVVSFEELGVDALFVDEAHAYKNNFSYTKMRNVAGITGVSSQRAMDMHQKCQYINELNNGRGVVYLTGTPISNTMAELYVLQKTMQPKALEDRGLLMFDSWASTYGVIESSLEIKPEGSGYQMKNRFAKFHNLPELMNMFLMIADIKTADMLDLPTPKLKTGAVQVIKTEITPEQKRIVMELAERAEKIRNGEVDSSEDNFLKLTLEARLLSTDPRAIDPDLSDDPNTKLNVCARKTVEIYHETAEKRLAQLIFCDQGTPKGDGSFNFYEATKEALIAQGVKPEEIAFIHDARTDVQREQLFEKVRTGEIRILMGSTSKMGTGMNVQNKLVALHHLDVPWRPSDLIQRNGRILRQGNDNPEISIFNYITEQTFDAYLWQILEQKQRYISQIMTGRSTLRSCEDVDSTMLQYAEFKALAVSDPRIKEKMETDNEINRLTVLKSSWQSQRNGLQYDISKRYPNEIASAEKKIVKMTADLEVYRQNKPAEFQMVIDGRSHDERTHAAEHFAVRARKLGREVGDTLDMGSYAGFSVSLQRGMMSSVRIVLDGQRSYSTDMGESALGNITRMENLAEHIAGDLEVCQGELVDLHRQLEAAKLESQKPFPNEEKLAQLQRKKVELDLALEFKDSADEIFEPDEDSTEALEDEPNGEENTTVRTQSSPARLTLEQKLYQKLAVFAGPILDGEAYYMKLKSDGFEDLVLEDIGGGEYSIAHYYTQNGDAMRDPEITFTIDKQNLTIHPTSFLQDDIGLFYETAQAKPSMVQDLKDFMSQWFTNIVNQGFEPEKVSVYASESETEDETEFER
ncbi:MAG: helicase-related protein [Candidatus Dehalobacter alkaniphilus]